MTYDLTSVKLPRLVGLPLELFAGALENPASKALIIGKVLRDGGVEQLRATPVQEPPTFAPLWFDHRFSGGAGLPALEEIRSPEAPRWSPSIRDYAEAYRSGKITPLEVAERLVAAIEQSRRQERPLGAVLVSDREDLLRQARASTERLRAGRPLSWLDGVPIGVKDELDQVPYPTTVGTSFLGGRPAAEDATPVARLRALGALLFGKLNMNEIGINPDGGNMNHGLVRNPYDLSRDPGGSSSGSAAAVAAGLCPAALGADGGGSIRIPAALNGVVGLKATFGRISEHGAAPLCWSVAHVGPLAATVEDVALIYAAIAGADPKDPMSQHQPAPSIEGWSSKDIAGLRIGIYRPWLEHASPEVVEATRLVSDRLRRLGVEHREIDLPDLNAMRVAHVITILSEMAAAMDPHRVRLKEMCLATRVNLAIGRSFTALDYLKAQRVRTRAMALFSRVLEDVDLILTPATAITAPEIPVSAALEGWSDLESVTEVMRYAFPGNLTGLPAITVPIGYDAGGLPIGVQLMGRPWAEHVLLRLARVIESQVERRRPPLFFELLST